MWPAPILPNGPLDKIEYYIRWTTQTKDGISKDMMTEAIKYEARDLYNNGLFSRTIDNLSPSHMYSVQVGIHSLLLFVAMFFGYNQYWLDGFMVLWLSSTRNLNRHLFWF